MDNTAAIAIGLTVGLVVLVFILVSLFIIRRRMVRRKKGKISPSETLPKYVKSLGSSNSSLRTSPPIPKKSATESSDQSSEKPKGQIDLKLSYEGSENRADSTQKIYPRLTPSDSPGPPIGDKSPRSSQDIQRRDNVTPTGSSQHLHEGVQQQIHQPQPHHPQLIIEGSSTTEEEVPPYYMQKPPPVPLSESPSPPPSPVRSPSRPGYAPDEDNPGPYPPAQPAQRRGLSRSSRQRSPMRGGRGSRSSSSNS